MSINQGPKIATKGLVFAYDMPTDNSVASSNKSWKGAPVTNVVTNTNLDTGWSKGYCTDIVFNDYPPPNGINSQVVSFRDADNNGSGYWYSYGNYAPQDPSTTYAISLWARTVGDGTFSVRPYTADNSETGRQYSNTLTVPNDGKWHRLEFDTITTPSNTQSDSLSFQFPSITAGKRVWICAPQMTATSYHVPFVAGTRSNTQALLDWTGNKTINLASMNYPSDGTFRFTSNSHNISVDSNTFTIARQKTLSIWIKSDRPLSVTDNWEVGFLNQGSTQGSMFGFMYGVGNCQDLGFWGYGSSYDMSVESTTNKWSSDGNWHNGVITMDSSRNVRVYIDGEAKQWLKHSDYSTKVDYVTMPIDTTNYFLINSRGSWNSGMNYVDLGNVMVYDRALTAAEVAQNFQALRGRYGI